MSIRTLAGIRRQFPLFCSVCTNATWHKLFHAADSYWFVPPPPRYALLAPRPKVPNYTLVTVTDGLHLGEADAKQYTSEWHHIHPLLVEYYRNLR